MWTGENDSNTLPLADAYFFEMPGTVGKEFPFSKSIRTGLDGVSLAADSVVYPSHLPVSIFFIFLSLKTILKKFEWVNETAVRDCAIIMNPPLITFADL